MSKQLTALLLQNSLSGKSVEEQRNFLINCLLKQGFIKDEEDKNIEEVSDQLCKVCNSDEFISTNHEEICKKCGTTRTNININPNKTFKQDINFSKSSFIEPGTLIINVVKDGKTVTRDLSKINTWLSSDPEEQRIVNNIKILNDVLDKIRGDYNAVVFEKVEHEIISMWYNSLILNKEMSGKEKKAFLAWSIYYPIVYNNLNISMQKISSILETFIGDIYSFNFRLKSIFKDTSFEKYISVPIGSSSDMEIPKEIQNKIKIIKKHLKEHLNDPLKDKQLYGILYYISKNSPSKPYTLPILSEKSGISSVTIANESKKIESFYDKNSKLKNILFM